MFGPQKGDVQPTWKRPNEVDYLWRSKVTSNCEHVPVMPVRRNWCVTTKPFQRPESRVRSSLRIADTKRPAWIGVTQRAQKCWLPSRTMWLQPNLLFRLQQFRNSWKRKIRSSKKKILVRQGGNRFLRRRVVKDSSNVVGLSKIVIVPVAADGWPPPPRRHRHLAANDAEHPWTPPVLRLTPGADVNDVATKVRVYINSFEIFVIPWRRAALNHAGLLTGTGATVRRVPFDLKI